MKALLRGEPTEVVRLAPYFLIGGMLGFVGSYLLDGFGAITAFSTVALGAAGASLEKWQTERGLWMLAALFAVIYAIIYGCFVYGRISDLLRGAPGVGIPLALDISIGSMLLLGQLRFLRSVVRQNYSLQ